jgi:zinc and cadmium transporter
MLGASFFHVMPDAMEKSGPLFGWWMSIGVVGLFCIERFIAPHSHEMADGHGHHHHEHEHGEHHHHEHNDHGPGEHKAAAPAIAGWMAVVGLTIHTFMNGVGLAGAVMTEGSSKELAWVAPGFAIFLAIVFHKPADALAISTVLTRRGVSKRIVYLVQVGFALMVSVGAVAYALTAGAIEEGLRSQLAGAALAFSAGTFLFIALSDLLPEVQFHTHDRGWLFLALLSGVVFMGGIAILEDMGHEEHPTAGQSQAHEDHAVEKAR